MASVAIQRRTPSLPSMNNRKRTLSSTSDGALYQSPSKHHKMGHRQPKVQAKKKPVTEDKKQLGSIFTMDAKVDLTYPFSSPATADRGRDSARKAQAELDRNAAERRAMAATVSDEWMENVLLKQPGFTNISGALCYRHSLLQALLHMPKFVNWLFEFHKLGECCTQCPSVCLACKMRDLATLYWAKISRQQEITAALRDINRILGLRGWKTDSDNGHGDPDDQFTTMLEMMAEDMGTSGHARFQAIHSTLLTSSIRCSSCGHTTEPHHSSERTLSLPLEPRLNGANLESFVSAFLRDKISGYRCDGCKMIVNVTREVKIASPADVITLQLKRAGWNGSTIKTKVGITHKLDLTAHAVDVSAPLQYELVSTVSHLGSSNFGHYISHAIGPDGKWTEFDDASTTKVSAKAPLAPPGKFKPVLLYYKRVKE